MNRADFAAFAIAQRVIARASGRPGVVTCDVSGPHLHEPVRPSYPAFREVSALIERAAGVPS